jgi:chromosome segregation ATPase
MILLGIFDMFTACDGKTAWGFFPFLLGAGLLGYLFRHFLGSNNNKAKEYEAQLGDWQGKYTTLQNDFKGYKSSITASSKDNDKQVGDLTNRIKSLEADIRNLADEKNKLSMSLTEKQTDLGGYSRKISTLEETIASINDEKNKISADWSAKLSAANESLSKASSWESRVKQAEEELARAKATVSDANKKQVEAEMRLKTTSEVAGKVGPLETEVKTWKEKYATLETQLSEHSSAATAYGTKLTEAENKYKTLVDENGKLKSAMGDKDKAVAEWEAKWRTANETAGKLGALESEIKSLKDNNAGFQSTLQEKDKSIAEWEAKWRTANETAGKLSGLESEIKSLKDNNAGFQSKLQEKDKSIAEWEAKWRTANETAGKLSGLESEIKSLKDNNAGFQSKLQEKDKSIAEWEAKWRTANETAGKLGALETEIKSLKDNNAGLQSKLQDKDKSIADWEVKWNATNEVAGKINGLQADVNNWKTKHDALQAQLNGKASAESDWNNKLQALTNENNQLKNNLDGRNKYAVDLEGKLNVAEVNVARIGGLEKDLADWRAKYESLSADLKASRASHDELEAKLALASKPKRRDDLVGKIEGIGAKIGDILHNAGISTFEELANTTPEHIQSILHAEGSQYKIHDPSTLTWPRQARLAADGKWAELKKWQDESLTVGREDGVIAVPDKKDDLTKIEGIGPKINGLLNDAGIYTFAKLSATKYEKLKTILEEAGERYRMHDPSTWPKQAELAANGKWDELKKLQDELKGGKI